MIAAGDCVAAALRSAPPSLPIEAGASEDASALLARLVATTDAHDVSGPAREAARLGLLDMLGCAIAGRRATGVPEVTRLMLDQGGAAQSVIWGLGERLPPGQAAFVNAMAGHALDFDDNHPGAAHIGVCVIPAVLAMAEAANVPDLDDVVTAIVTATEVADRIASAVTDGPGVTGWLLTPLAGYFGAAAGAARMLALDGAYLQQALGFAYVQASGNGQSTLDGALAKRMQPGFASRGGVFAAELAAAGLTAPTNSLEGARGFFHVYHHDRYDPALLRREVSSGWLIEQATFKPYPCCAWTHSALECAMAIAAAGIASSSIVRVDVGVSAQAYRSTGTPLPRRYEPRTSVDAQFSIPYTFATAFLTGSVRLNDFEGEALFRADRRELAAKVHVSVDEELDAAYGRGVSPARVVATLVDGTRQEHLVIEPCGLGDRRMTPEQIREKFMMCCAAGGMARDKAERLAETILAGRSTWALLEQLASPLDKPGHTGAAA